MSGLLGNQAFSNIKFDNNIDNLIMIPKDDGFEPLIIKESNGNYVFNIKFLPVSNA